MRLYRVVYKSYFLKPDNYKLTFVVKDKNSNNEFMRWCRQPTR